jgi:hypothetical protein
VLERCFLLPAYIVTVAETLDLPRATFTDLTVEVEVESIAGAKLLGPPPVPRAAR